MQAAVVNHGRVRVQSVPQPQPASGEVLVRMRYASVNPADWKIASSHGGLPPPGTQTEGADAILLQPGPALARSFVPGFDGAGVIAALGAGVTGFTVGEPVMLWSHSLGTYAQFVAVSAQAIARPSRRWSLAQAAGVPHTGYAAWSLLVDQAKVHQGERVLVLGGAGGVGSAAVQIAHALGAHVIATASARSAAYVRSLGAEQVIDYTSQHFEEQLRDIDVAINTVDADNATRALAVLRRGGRLFSVGPLPPPSHCATRAVSCTARTEGTTPIGTVLQRLAEWGDTGAYSVHVDRTFQLAEVLQAWEYSEAGHTHGKAVLHIP